MFPANYTRKMLQLARELFPLNRSLTGPGVRETLHILQREMPKLEMHSVPSGSEVFGWTVPKEWHCEDAYIVTPSGEKICKFSHSNLHVVGYSTPVDTAMPLEELNAHLHSLPSVPEAIPYATSYYKETWGFCLSEHQRKILPKGNYRAVIKSKLYDGLLNWAEFALPGDTEAEVLFSTNICHPSMFDNELSGIVVVTELAKRIAARPARRYSYRFLFIPETIGSIVYKHLAARGERPVPIVGCAVYCVGRVGAPHIVMATTFDCRANRAAQSVGAKMLDWYTWRASDERQFCHLPESWPVCGFTMNPPGNWPGYHTSLDNMDVASEQTLYASVDWLESWALAVERAEYRAPEFPCEPQLSRRGLYRTLSTVAAVDMSALNAYAIGNGLG